MEWTFTMKNRLHEVQIWESHAYFSFQALNISHNFSIIYI